jgi:5-methyltetrahydropteroyltriglutamate--homocysteine methyltransferase
MESVALSLTGPFPRSEELVQATREWDRGLRAEPEVQALYQREARRICELESALGFGWVTGGFLSWQDLFRPFTGHVAGLRVGPLSRWFETNTFFRRPIVEGPPAGDGGALLGELPLDVLREFSKPRKVILPGPYTFSGLVDNQTDLTRWELARLWSEVLAREVETLSRHGYQFFQLQEPLLVVDPPSREEEGNLLQAYAPLARPLASAASLVWTYFGDASSLLPLLVRLPVGGVGLDLSDTDPIRLREFPSGLTLGLGCLDPRTSLPEDPLDIARLVRELSERLRPASIHLGAGAPLDLLPWEPARRKLEVLRDASRILQSTGRRAHRSSLRQAPTPQASRRSSSFHPRRRRGRPTPRRAK